MRFLMRPCAAGVFLFQILLAGVPLNAASAAELFCSFVNYCDDTSGCGLSALRKGFRIDNLELVDKANGRRAAMHLSEDGVLTAYSPYQNGYSFLLIVFPRQSTAKYTIHERPEQPRAITHHGVCSFK